MTTPVNICVVVPYFQRERGILTRAVNSILSQKPRLPREIIIVDDGSPVPARVELAEIMLSHPGLLRIIEQPNGGPSRARNTGLDQVPPDTDFVSFLDSDDEWSPNFLDTAIAALDHGFDLFFCDFYQLDHETPLIKDRRPFEVDRQTLLDPERALYAFTEDVNDKLIRNTFIRTVCSVYRWKLLSNVRFNEALRWSDEDTQFFLECIESGARVCFTSDALLKAGHGVNINADTPLGTAKLSRRLCDEALFGKIARDRFADTESQKGFLVDTQRARRTAFLRNTLYMLVKGKVAESIPLIRRFVAVDPMVVFDIFPYLVAMTARKLRGIDSSSKANS